MTSAVVPSAAPGTLGRLRELRAEQHALRYSSSAACFCWCRSLAKRALCCSTSCRAVALPPFGSNTHCCRPANLFSESRYELSDESSAVAQRHMAAHAQLVCSLGSDQPSSTYNAINPSQASLRRKSVCSLQAAQTNNKSTMSTRRTLSLCPGEPEQIECCVRLRYASELAHRAVGTTQHPRGWEGVRP